MNLSQISERFISKYSSKKTSPTNNENNQNQYDEYKNNPILQPSLLLNHAFVEANTTQYEEDRVLLNNAAVAMSSNQQITRAEKNNGVSRHQLIIALLKCFGRKFFALGVFKLANDCLNFSGPLLLNQLVLFIETDQSSLRQGSEYAAALFITTLLSAFLNVHFTNAMNKLSLRIRSALIACIYRKAVLVKLNELSKHSIGQIVNYMSIDSGSITNAFPSFHQFWSLPFQISITLYLLYAQIGLSFLVGVGFVVILIPVNKLLSDYIGKVQKRLMLYKDQRVKVVTEFLQGRSF